MKAPLQYLGHVGVMADYCSTFLPRGGDTEVAQDFETIYGDALEVKYGEAKRYLAGLDVTQMETIRAYHRMVNGIDIATLDEEGAYNLLVHRYEQLDFNGDGLVKNGTGTVIPLFPQEMPNDLKSSIVDALQQMEEEGLERFRDISPITIMLSFKFNAHAMMAQLKDKPGPWENLPLSEPNYDYSALTQMQESLHNPAGGAYASQEYIDLFDRFMETLASIMEERGSDIKGAGDASQPDAAPQEQDTRIASFFDRVRTAGGALNFIQQLNLEKIEKLIEEKRRELEAKMGLDAKPPLPEEERVKIAEQIDAILTEYKKNLLEDMEKRSGSNHFDKDAFLRRMMNAPENKEEAVKE